MPLSPLLSLAALVSTAEAGTKGLLAAKGVVKPLKFDRKFLVCNAYPSEHATKITKNGAPLESTAALNFQDCQYVNSEVLPKDKLDFEVPEVGIQGTFEVGELPDSDAVLLLVVQKRDGKSPLMSFQSFAFPINPKTTEAHIAVIDASTNLPKSNLKIRDHPADVKKKAREEELIFDRIYALDSGNYEVSVDKTKPQSVTLDSKKDYVLLRTGDGEAQQALVAFPRDPILQSGANTLVPAVVALLCALQMFF